MYNLLLVDDEPLIKVAFQSAVEWGKNGFLLAATASNGQEALHIVETQHIDGGYHGLENARHGWACAHS